MGVIRVVAPRFLDTSKQGFAAFTVHLANIGIAMLLAAEAPEVELDGCSWYWMSVLTDCTVGVGIMCVLLAALQAMYRRIGRHELAKLGAYGDPPDLTIWARQCFDFQMVVLANKLFLFVLFVVCRDVLGVIASGMLGILDPYPRAKLVVVMVVTPVLLNVFAFWVIDNVVMAQMDAEPEKSPQRLRLRLGWRALGRPVERERADLFTEFEQWRRSRSGDL